MRGSTVQQCWNDKKCKVETVINMAITFNMAFHLFRQMLPIVQPCVCSSFFTSQLYFEYHDVVKRRLVADLVVFNIKRSGLSGPKPFTSSFSSRDNQ